MKKVCSSRLDPETVAVRWCGALYLHLPRGGEPCCQLRNQKLHPPRHPQLSFQTFSRETFGLHLFHIPFYCISKFILFHPKNFLKKNILLVCDFFIFLEQILFVCVVSVLYSVIWEGFYDLFTFCIVFFISLGYILF